MLAATKRQHLPDASNMPLGSAEVELVAHWAASAVASSVGSSSSQLPALWVPVEAVRRVQGRPTSNRQHEVDTNQPNRWERQPHTAAALLTCLRSRSCRAACVATCRAFLTNAEVTIVLPGEACYVFGVFGTHTPEYAAVQGAVML